jgi:hypothetical protein
VYRLVADLNDEDDEGLGWSTLSEASDPARIRPGVMLVAGNHQAQAVVRVVAVDDDGQVHFIVLTLVVASWPPSAAERCRLTGVVRSFRTAMPPVRTG